MNVGSLSAGAVTTGSLASKGLERFKPKLVEGQSEDGPSPEEAAKHFEGVFMSMILKEMRATLSEGLFGKEASDTFGALFDLHMGEHLAERGGLGIREMVADAYRQNSLLKEGTQDSAIDVLDAQ